MLIGIAIVGVAVALKAFDSDIKDEIFHLWSGIPVSVKSSTPNKEEYGHIRAI